MGHACQRRLKPQLQADPNLTRIWTGVGRTDKLVTSLGESQNVRFGWGAGYLRVDFRRPVTPGAMCKLARCIFVRAFAHGQFSFSLGKTQGTAIEAVAPMKKRLASCLTGRHFLVTLVFL